MLPTGLDNSGHIALLDWDCSWFRIPDVYSTYWMHQDSSLTFYLQLHCMGSFTSASML